MEPSRLKYRIVGGLVLVSLLAILAPALNDLRQPLPQGPQTIEIPDEPVDRIASALPADGPPVTGTLPEVQDIPLPVAPPAYESQDESPVTPGQAAPESASSIPPVPSPPPAPKERISSVPAAPVTKATPIVASKPPVARPVPAKPAPPMAGKPSPAASGQRTVTPPPAPGAEVTAVSQQAWVVQLGTFSNVKTAVDLRERLRKAGYSAFTEQVNTPQGVALRVRVGPEIDRAASQALVERLSKETGQSAIVMSYP
ncbi:MAG: SPOR domain-containing protein [Immundisolibacter sp.]|uniref:SPOR domain-containing protein n=1 Tax=Immundisolibacter sp. TaxID=1934948 RepID=UPI003EE2FB84